MSASASTAPATARLTPCPVIIAIGTGPIADIKAQQSAPSAMKGDHAFRNEAAASAQ